MSARAGDTRGIDAMQELCTAYWYPLYAYSRRLGSGSEDAEDLTQAFFAHILSADVVNRVDQGAGRLRSYLLTAFKNFIHQEWRRSQGKRRGGEVTFVSWDNARAEEWLSEKNGKEYSPDREFDRNWARTVLDRVLHRLRQSWERRGEEARFDVLAPFLAEGAAEVTDGYRVAAKELGMTENAVRVAVFRLRKAYRKQLRDEIADTVGNSEEIEEEIEALFTALAQ